MEELNEDDVEPCAQKKERFSFPQKTEFVKSTL